jgi:soluble lytic murein transglycosylase
VEASHIAGKGIQLKTAAKIIVIAAVVLACAMLIYVGFQTYMKAAYPMEYEQTVSEQSKLNGIDESLAFSVIRTESRFNPEAQSVMLARGLMQITEPTYDWLKFRMGEDGTTYDDMYDAETNIRYGCAFLGLLMDEYDDVATALCAYHSGRAATARILADKRYSDDGKTIDTIPYEKASAYVKQVQETIEIYKRLYNIV